MDTKHTPGPWEVDNTGSLVRSTAKGLKKDHVHGYGHGDNGFICDLNDGEYHEYSDGAEQIANSRLIAAAPELLEALQAIMKACEACENDDNLSIVDLFTEEMESAARAAIKKATQP